VPSVFRNTPPADAEDEALRTEPEDWRAQTAEQKAAIDQFHIARIAEHFRQTGARVKQHAEVVFHHPDCAYFTANEGAGEGETAA
jgi:pterin-4a-carbinolamine dehydratase